MNVYYNEIDQKAAAWLKELMKEGLISDGDVDTRSIEDVVPAELAGYDRCHFFAGIGVWDYALSQAGFEGRCWTGSCPCQPFSTAGKGEGFDDERHLWPSWFHLIEVCRPDVIFGEQVSSKDGETWLDLVHADLEGIGYATGTLDIPAASVGAPHRRQRFFFVADSEEYGWQQGGTNGGGSLVGSRAGKPVRSANMCILGGMDDSETSERRSPNGAEYSRRWSEEVGRSSSSSELGSAVEPGLEGLVGNEYDRNEPGRIGADETRPASASSESCGMEITPTFGRRGRSDGDPSGCGGQVQAEGRGSLGGLADAAGDGHSRGYTASIGADAGSEQGRMLESSRDGSNDAGYTNGFWSGPEWVYCNDPDSPRWRPIEPGTFPLASRTPGRVGLLRGYGNAIVAPVAIEFIKAYLETKEG